MSLGDMEGITKKRGGGKLTHLDAGPALQVQLPPRLESPGDLTDATTDGENRDLLTLTPLYATEVIFAIV